jgi:hypothetical protein
MFQFGLFSFDNIVKVTILNSCVSLCQSLSSFPNFRRVIKFAVPKSKSLFLKVKGISQFFEGRIPHSSKTAFSFSFSFLEVTFIRYIFQRNIISIKEMMNIISESNFHFKRFIKVMISNTCWDATYSKLLRAKHSEFGRKWAKIVHYFPRRTDPMVKNRSAALSRGAKNPKKVEHSLFDGSTVGEFMGGRCPI